MEYSLPKTIKVNNREYSIRSDYRAILDICTALSDPDLSGQEKSLVLLSIFYEEPEKIPAQDYKEAVEQCFWFINCGNNEKGEKQATKLVDWEQDFQYIVAPINRVSGCEIRALDYMHWWTFIAAYYEIGDCLLAQIVRIRKKLKEGRALDKEERKWYRENKDIVDFKQTFSDAEEDILKQWTGK